MESAETAKQLQQHLTNLEAARANAIEVLCRAGKRLEATEKHNYVVNHIVVKHLDCIDGLLDLYGSGSKNHVDWLIRIKYGLQEAVKNGVNPLCKMNQLVQKEKEQLVRILQKYNVPHLLQALNEEGSCKTN